MEKIRNLTRGGESTYPWDLEKNYTISNVLGQGSFAVVRKCTDKRTNVDYALKIISKDVLKEQMLTTELDVLKQVNHPHLVTLHELVETKDNVYIITDLASGGELYSQLEQRGNYTEKDAAHLVEQDLINKMLTYKPDERITAHDALKHPWFEYAAKLNIDSNHHTRSETVSYPRATLKLKKAIHVIQGVTKMRRISKTLVNKYHNMFDDYTNGVIGAGVGYVTSTIIEENNGSNLSASSQPLGSSGLLGSDLPVTSSNTKPISNLSITNQNQPTEFYMHSNKSGLDIGHLTTNNSVSSSRPFSISPTSPTASNSSKHAIIV
ncbi:17022_t:CDS:2 [Racocetra fulgida]|uniref:17022_t:CDS:1 n=1 Tax=Racocetra fulgida TaxID=60492 RepID=A0A9N8ZT32_9GLOM|nr:17022_t:CDS:2 [Racocetra fulgida]